jgi:hypothetical protein
VNRIARDELRALLDAGRVVLAEALSDAALAPDRSTTVVGATTNGAA